MDIKKLVLGLSLGAACFAGCDDTGEDPPVTTVTTITTRPDMGPDITCADPGSVVVYRLDSLTIPTEAAANAGETVGHNIDGVGEVCLTPDYTGGVDNALISLNTALPTLSEDVDLQAEIDNALNCPADSVDCTRLDLLVSVATGVGCVEVTVRDGDGVVLAGPFAGTLDANGNMRGVVASLDLSIPFAVEGSAPVDVNLSVTNVIITATRTESALTNVVIGGALAQQAFESTIMSLLNSTNLGDTVSFEDIQGILANLYDVEIDGQCGALSVGLTASGSLVPAT